MGRVTETIKKSLRDRIKFSREEIAGSEARIKELNEDIMEATRYLAEIETKEKK